MVVHWYVTTQSDSCFCCVAIPCCRDPFALRAEQLGEEGQVLSDWDRFARGEYLRLAVEEEPEDMQVGCYFVMLHAYVTVICYVTSCHIVWTGVATQTGGTAMRESSGHCL
jgi:hypothetical protein